MNRPKEPRVLSIQSHTVHGYVGQKACTFPLELLGIEVDPVNSVQLSNHKAYEKGAKGQVLQGEELFELIEGLDMNDLLGSYTHLLTGYIGSVSFLKAVLSTAKKIRERNPDLIYFCDPVLGDHGKFYVPQDLVALYRDEVVSVATVLTPNQFEVEQLTGIQINNESDAWRACDMLHDRGVETVVITSCSLGIENQVSLLCSACSKPKGNHGEKAIKLQKSHYAVDIPLIPGRYSGTGDLMAALLLAWSTRCPEDLAKALELSCSTVYAVIQRTHDAVENGENPYRELRLIQSSQDILNPPLQGEDGKPKMQALVRD
jgi:pyridoxine kinase